MNTPDAALASTPAADRSLRARTVRFAGAMALGALVTNTAVTAQPKTELPELLRLAGSYVDAFQRDFRRTIAQEEYIQERLLPDSSQRRTIHSEVGSIELRQGEPWIWVRSIIDVDGRRVPDSESRLQHALTDTSADAASTVRALRDEGARFNVGGVYRNFNDPTFALNFLDATLQPRFKFTIDGHGKVGAREAVKISFQELQAPTLVRDGDEDVRSSGALWISPVDGTVLRTRLTFSIREPVPASKGPVNDPDPPSTINTHAQIDVDYGLVGPIGGWAPVRMHETYEQTILTLKQRRSFVERVTCTATYSQFQVYLTAGRILPSS